MTDPADSLTDPADSRLPSSLGPATRQLAVPAPDAGQAWQRFKGGVDLTQAHFEAPTHVAGRDSQGKDLGVILSRTFGSAASVIWTKSTHPQHPQLAPLAHWETSNMAFLAERTGRSNRSLLPFVVRAHQVVLTQHAPGDENAPASSSMIGRNTAVIASDVRTLHAGVSIDRLLTCRVPRRTTDGQRLAHALAPPLNLLHLVRQVLAALQAVAEQGMQHGDVAFRNIAVPNQADSAGDEHDGDGYRLQLEWAKAKLIDFGLSCRNDLAPPAALPRDPGDPSISMRLRRICGQVQQAGADLAIFRSLDWREDLYQFGFELRQHVWRHGVNPASGLRGANGERRQDAVRALLWGDASARRPGLLEQLIAYGCADQCDPLPSTATRPHAGFIQQLDDVIGRLKPEHDAADDLLFWRDDTDAVYRREFARQRQAQQQQARLDQAELSDWKAAQGSLQAERARQAKEAASLAARTTALAQAQTSHGDARASLAQARGDHDQSVSDLAQREQALAQEHQTLTQQQRALAQVQQELAHGRQALAQERTAWQSQVDSLAAQRRAQAAASAIATSPPPLRLLPKFPGLPHGPELVELPTGSYQRGSPVGEAERRSNEGPQRRVSIAYRLAVARYAVTFDEWDQCITEGGCPGKPFGNISGREPVVGIYMGDILKYFLPWVNCRAGLDKTESKYQIRLIAEFEWKYALAVIGNSELPYPEANQTARLSALQPVDTADRPIGHFTRVSTVNYDTLREPNGWGLYPSLCKWHWVPDDSYDDRTQPTAIALRSESHVSQESAQPAHGDPSSELRLWRFAGYFVDVEGERIEHTGFRLARMLSPES